MVHHFQKHLVYIEILDIASLQIGSMPLSPIFATQSLRNTILDTRKTILLVAGAAMPFGPPTFRMRSEIKSGET